MCRQPSSWSTKPGRATIIVVPSSPRPLVPSSPPSSSSSSSSSNEDIQAAAAAQRRQQTLNHTRAGAVTSTILVVSLASIRTRLALVRTLLIGALLIGTLLVRTLLEGALLLLAVEAHVGLLLVVSALSALWWVTAAVLALALGWVLAVVGGLGRLGAGVVGWRGVGWFAGHDSDDCECLGVTGGWLFFFSFLFFWLVVLMELRRSAAISRLLNEDNRVKSDGFCGQEVG